MTTGAVKWAEKHLYRRLWVFGQWNAVNWGARHNKNALYLSCVHFATLTTLCRNSELCVHDVMDLRISLAICLRKEHSRISYVLLAVLCSHVLSTENAIWIMWTSKRPCKALQNLGITLPATNAWKISERTNLQLIGELTSSLQPDQNLAFGLHYARSCGSFYVHFIESIRAVGKRLVKAEAIIQDWKSSFKTLMGGKSFRDGKRSHWIWREIAYYHYVYFCNPDYIMRKIQSLHTWRHRGELAHVLT